VDPELNKCSAPGPCPQNSSTSQVALGKLGASTMRGREHGGGAGGVTTRQHVRGTSFTAEFFVRRARLAFTVPRVHHFSLVIREVRTLTRGGAKAGGFCGSISPVLGLTKSRQAGAPKERRRLEPQQHGCQQHGRGGGSSRGKSQSRSRRWVGLFDFGREARGEITLRLWWRRAWYSAVDAGAWKGGPSDSTLFGNCGKSERV